MSLFIIIFVVRVLSVGDDEHDEVTCLPVFLLDSIKKNLISVV